MQRILRAVNSTVKKFQFIAKLVVVCLLGTLISGIFAVTIVVAKPPPGWEPPPTELLIIIPYKEPADPDILIQEDEGWISEANRLDHHKYSTGIDAIVLTLNDINRDYAGRDEAERVKQAIYAYVRDSGIKYVMLVGDANIMPVRYQHIGYTSDGATFYSHTERHCNTRHCDADGPPCTEYCAAHPDRCNAEGSIIWCPYEYYRFIATDAYYANLWDDDDPGLAFEDWDNDGDDNDGDNIFGELYFDNVRGVDGNTIHADVAVGRVPARTPTEFSMYIDKITAYENGMRFSDARRRALLTSGSMGAGTHRSLGGEFGHLYEVTYIEKIDDTASYHIEGPGVDETTFNPSLFMTEYINTNPPRFLGYGGHGHPDCWCEPGFGQPQAIGLSNELPFIAAAASCSTARMVDQTLDLAPPPAPVTDTATVVSMSDAFLTRTSGGAVVYVGAVTTSQDGAHDIERYFFREIRDGADTTGDAWIAALESYIDTYSLDVFAHSPLVDDATHPDGHYWKWQEAMDDFYHVYKMNFFGDPSLRPTGVTASADDDPATTRARYGDRVHDDPATTRARYVKRVHVDPDNRYVRIVFYADDTDSGVSSTRYRYRLDKSWTGWLSGSEIYLPLPMKPKKAQGVQGVQEKQIHEATIEYYSIDNAGNREQTKAARIKYDYTSPDKDISAKKAPKPAALKPSPNIPAQSKLQVKGKVIDNMGNPLRATLKLSNRTFSRKALSDAQGWYSFSNIPPGTYRLKVSQAPAVYRQFVPDTPTYMITLDKNDEERGFVYVVDDYAAPTMTQELPWDTVAASGCVYGLAYDDWYGTGAKGVSLAVSNAKGRWLNANEQWQNKKTWFKPQHFMGLDEFLHSYLVKRLAKRLPQLDKQAEQAKLEPLACRLASDCQPRVWAHCFKNKSVLSGALTKVHGKLTDKKGNISFMESTNTLMKADFAATPMQGPVPLIVQFKDLSQGNVVHLDWHFGEGTKSTASRPTYTYKKPGVYKVTLTTAGPYGWDTITKKIRVTGNKKSGRR